LTADVAAPLAPLALCAAETRQALTAGFVVVVHAMSSFAYGHTSFVLSAGRCAWAIYSGGNTAAAVPCPTAAPPSRFSSSTTASWWCVFFERPEGRALDHNFGRAVKNRQHQLIANLDQAFWSPEKTAAKHLEVSSNHQAVYDARGETVI
jgi:hypothetical protein